MNTYFWPHEILMQPTKTDWTTLVGDFPGIISVKFGQNPISGSEEKLFKEIVGGRTHGRWTTDNGPSQKLTLSTLWSGELKIHKFTLNVPCLKIKSIIPISFFIIYFSSIKTTHHSFKTKAKIIKTMFLELLH